MKKYTWILVVAAVAPLFPLACGGGTTSSTSTGAGGTGGSATTGSNTTGTTATGTTTAGSTAASTGTGAGVDTIAACDAPVSAPSKGACYVPAGTTSSSAASSSAASTAAASSSSSSTGAGGGSTGATSSSSTGGAPDCSGFFNPGDCGTCAEASCCAEIAACKANPDCIDCITGNDPSKCAVGAAQMQTDAVNTCTDTKCNAECALPSCNPITNEGCDADAGEACDHTATGFGCFPAPNDSPICQECDNQAGPFCEAGHTCLPDGGCAAYCCDDADCGANGKCDTTVITLAQGGVCVKK